jgi:hypothetical protein
MKELDVRLAKSGKWMKGCRNAGTARMHLRLRVHATMEILWPREFLQRDKHKNTLLSKSILKSSGYRTLSLFRKKMTDSQDSQEYRPSIQWGRKVKVLAAPYDKAQEDDAAKVCFNHNISSNSNI